MSVITNILDTFLSNIFTRVTIIAICIVNIFDMSKMFSKMSTKAVRMLLPLKTKKVTNIATFMAFKSSCQIFPAITTNLAIFTTELGRSTSFVAYFPHSVSPFSRPFHTTSVANITKQIGEMQKVFPLCCKFVDHAMVFATVISTKNFTLINPALL